MRDQRRSRRRPEQAVSAGAILSGIGALVRVEAGGVTQRTLVRSGSSYLSQSDLRPHFGLGKETAAKVEIRWPSGQVDRYEKVACDRIWTIREGAAAPQMRAQGH